MSIFRLSACNNAIMSSFDTCGNLVQHSIVDAFQSSDFAYFLSIDNKVYISKQLDELEKTNENYDESITQIFVDEKILKVSANKHSKVAFFLSEKGEVFIHCKEKSEKIAFTFEVGTILDLECSEDSFAVYDGSSLFILKYKNPSCSELNFVAKIDLKGHKIKKFLGFKKSCIMVLFENGLICSTINFIDSPMYAQPINGLFVKNSLIGCDTCNIFKVGKYFGCLNDNRSLALLKVTGADGEDANLAYIINSEPPKSEMLIQIFKKCYYFGLTKSGKFYIFINGKFISINDDKSHDHIALQEMERKKISHISKIGKKLYFFHNEFKYGDNIENPFIGKYFYTKLDQCTDLNENIFGIQKDDVYFTDNGQYILVYGTLNNKIYYLNIKTQEISTCIFQKSLLYFLFNWVLIKRKNGIIEEINIKGNTTQIDVSKDGLMRICDFIPGDIIEHSKYGKGTVLGERGNGMWIQFSDEIRMCKISQDTWKNIKIISRKDVDRVECLKDVNGNQIITEIRNYENFELSDIVQSKKFGIGRYIGTSKKQIIVNFIQDCNRYRIIKPEKLEVLRRNNFYTKFIDGIDYSLLKVDISENLFNESGIYPCDIIKVNDQTACFIGISEVNNVKILLFQTEFLLKNGISSAGTFAIEKSQMSYQLLARIDKPGTVIKTLKNGQTIELSVNVNDFENTKLLPSDEIEIDGTNYTVSGIKDGQIYIEKEFCFPFNVQDESYELIYRRLFVPTKRIVSGSSGKNFEGKIDLMDCFNSRVIPMDYIKYEGKDYKIISIIDNTNFVVEDLETTEKHQLTISRNEIINITYSKFDITYKYINEQ